MKYHRLCRWDYRVKVGVCRLGMKLTTDYVGGIGMKLTADYVGGIGMK